MRLPLITTDLKSSPAQVVDLIEGAHSLGALDGDLLSEICRRSSQLDCLFREDATVGGGGAGRSYDRPLVVGGGQYSSSNKTELLSPSSTTSTTEDGKGNPRSARERFRALIDLKGSGRESWSTSTSRASKNSHNVDGAARRGEAEDEDPFLPERLRRDALVQHSMALDAELREREKMRPPHFFSRLAKSKEERIVAMRGCGHIDEESSTTSRQRRGGGGHQHQHPSARSGSIGKEGTAGCAAAKGLCFEDLVRLVRVVAFYPDFDRLLLQRLRRYVLRLCRGRGGGNTNSTRVELATAITDGRDSEFFKKCVNLAEMRSAAGIRAPACDPGPPVLELEDGHRQGGDHAPGVFGATASAISRSSHDHERGDRDVLNQLHAQKREEEELEFLLSILAGIQTSSGFGGDARGSRNGDHVDEEQYLDPQLQVRFAQCLRRVWHNVGGGASTSGAVGTRQLISPLFGKLLPWLMQEHLRSLPHFGERGEFLPILQLMAETGFRDQYGVDRILRHCLSQGSMQPAEIMAFGSVATALGVGGRSGQLVGQLLVGEGVEGATLDGGEGHGGGRGSSNSVFNSVLAGGDRNCESEEVEVK